MLDVTDVGVGFLGLICGWARALATSSNCSRGLDASWRVKDPSDQRRMRAFDCFLDESLGEYRQRTVLVEVWDAEKVAEGGPEE